MSPEFWITTIAIVLGPIGAVVIAQLLQERNAKKQQKFFVFRALMATRRTPVSPERVQALNLVEIEFSSDEQVLKEFKELLKVYNDRSRWENSTDSVRSQLLRDVEDRSVNLLSAMASTLGFRFETLDLLRGGYLPDAMSLVELQQAEIRDFFVALNRGQKGIPVDILDVRPPAKLLEQTRQSEEVLEFALREEKKSPEAKE